MKRQQLTARFAACVSTAAIAFLGGSCEVGAASPGEPVTIYLDGSEVLVLEPSDVTAPLDLLKHLGVAPEDVRYAELRAPDETPIRTPEPLQKYPKRRLAAFPVADGIGVGWVDLRLGELPTALDGVPPVSFAPATEVRLRTLDVERAAGTVEKLPLRVVVGEQSFEYATKDLNALNRFGPAQALGLDGGRQAQSGVPLSSLVQSALERASVTLDDVEAAIASGPDGEVRLEASELAEKTTRAAAIKRNRKGLWRLKTWAREGDAAVERDGLRGVDRIEILLK